MSDEKRMRNIILYHLESLNYVNYRMNRHLFKCLYEIERKSCFFEKYYSTATSTVMVMADLAYGSQLVFEKSRRLRWNNSYVCADSILEKLQKRGYYTDIIALSNDVETIDIINDMSLFGKDVSVNSSDDIDVFHNQIEKAVSQNDPFGLWICNFSSHVDENSIVSKEPNGLIRWREGYHSADLEVEYLFRLLKNNRLLEDTTIVLYGDHGDDIFSHGMHMGLVHAVEPCEQLIHAPFFVYDERLLPGVSYNLISTEDILPLALLLVDSSAISNENVLSMLKRKYVFSRNMFAAQRVKEKSFGKAYCMCDGEYMLSVSNKGLAMYNTETDPFCGNNLLRFFEKCKGGFRINDGLNYRYHFKSLFDLGALDSVLNQYNKMIPKLKDYTQKMYSEGKAENRVFEMNYDDVQDKLDLIVYDKLSEEEMLFDIFKPYFIGKKIVIYGAGRYGRYCYEMVKEICSVIAWVDKSFQACTAYDGLCITSPNSIVDEDYDFIYVAIGDDDVFYQAYNELVALGISEEKIVG